MITKQITVNDVIFHRPCEAYLAGDDGSPTDRLISLVGDGLPATAETVEYLRDRRVPDHDIVWIACRVLDPAIRASWLERIVTRAVETHALHCGVPAIETWARAWLSGEDRSAEWALWDSSEAAAAEASVSAEAEARGGYWCEAEWCAAAVAAAAAAMEAVEAARWCAAAAVDAAMAAAAAEAAAEAAEAARAAASAAAAAAEAAEAAERAQQVDDLIAVFEHNRRRSNE